MPHASQLLPPAPNPFSSSWQQPRGGLMQQQQPQQHHSVMPMAHMGQYSMSSMGMGQSMGQSMGMGGFSGIKQEMFPDPMSNAGMMSHLGLGQQ